MLSRRKFIQQTSFAITGVSLQTIVPVNAIDAEEMVMTVAGPKKATDLQFTLTHEHILVDFIGAAGVNPSRYEVSEVVKTALPFLQAIKTAGCNSFVDCTPAYIGRDVNVLKQLSSITGLNIITNTGYYGAVAEKYLPAFVFTETARQLAQRWINEWKNGIDGTSIRPGFIKSGVDKAPLTAAQEKIIIAAAITHLQTGLTIAVHTGDGEAAKQQLKILAQNGVSPEAWIWVHAQNENDRMFQLEAARKGAWVSFDGANASSLPDYIGFLNLMKKEQLLHRVLVSQDSGWYHIGEPGGGEYNGYGYITSQFIPSLLREGFTKKEINQIFITNPANAFTIHIRKSV